MARKSKSAKQAELMTLTEVHRRTKISMPTLQKYKKKHAGRIPSVGEGRTQRYPEEALAVFEQIKEENVARRGRPKAASDTKKAAKGKGTKRRSSRKKRTAKASVKAAEASPADTAAPAEPELLSLTEISRRTRISQPTLTRYVKQNPDIPHVVQGKRKVYPLEAIPLFVEMREAKKRAPKKSKPKAKRKVSSKAKAKTRSKAKAKTKAKARSRRPARVAKKKAAPGADLESIASTLADVESRLANIESQLAKPIVVEVKR